MNMKTYLENRTSEWLVRRIACQAWYSLPGNNRRKNHDCNDKIIDKRQSVNVQVERDESKRISRKRWGFENFHEFRRIDVQV